MDKQLLKAYIKVMVEEETRRLLPELLAEAIAEIKKAQSLTETVTPQPTKSPIDRNRLAELMGLNYDRDTGTLRATGVNRSASTPNMLTAKDEAGNTRHIPVDQVDPGVVQALTKDYSAMMKKLKL